MDLESAIYGAIVIAIIIILLLILSQSSKKRKKEKLQSLINLANKHNCKISQHEICGNYVIGIDEIKNTIFFYKQINNKVVEQFIDLAAIKKCKVINISRTISNKDSNINIVDKLELSFIPIVKNKTEIILEFFNTDYSPQLCGELQSIEKWAKTINDRLKN